MQQNLKNSKGSTPLSWSIESYHLAIEKGYANGRLLMASKASEADALPGGYSKEAKAVAENQAVLAGNRLADMINSLFP